MKTLQYKNKQGQWVSIPIIGSIVTQEDLAKFIDSVKYNEETQEMEFYHGETLIDTLDVTPFLVDNFVKNAEIVGTDLVITFNTEDKPDIKIPLEKIFNPKNYYTKEEIEQRLEEELYEEGEPNTNGYDYVDMGEAGIWATCNIGATKPEEFGLYFAWGETEGYTKEQIDKGDRKFDWDSYKFGTKDNITKYNSIDNLTELEPEDDAAHVLMGGNWKIPTENDYKKLFKLCDFEWITNYKQTGINGFEISLKEDASKTIFFPAAGNVHSILGGIGTSVNCWNSTPWYMFDYPNYAGMLWFIDTSVKYTLKASEVCAGLPIRAFIPVGTKVSKYLTKKEADETYATKEYSDAGDKAILDKLGVTNLLSKESENLELTTVDSEDSDGHAYFIGSVKNGENLAVYIENISKISTFAAPGVTTDGTKIDLMISKNGKLEGGIYLSSQILSIDTATQNTFQGVFEITQDSDVAYLVIKPNSGAIPVSLKGVTLVEGSTPTPLDQLSNFLTKEEAKDFVAKSDIPVIVFKGDSLDTLLNNNYPASCGLVFDTEKSTFDDIAAYSNLVNKRNIQVILNIKNYYLPLNLTKISSTSSLTITGYIPSDSELVSNGDNSVSFLYFIYIDITYGAKSITGYGYRICLLEEFDRKKLKSYPEITEAMKTDGIAYALINGKWEGIASAGKNVVTYNPTQTAALNALQTGQVPTGLKPEEVEQVKDMLGEYWDQLEDVPVTADEKPEDVFAVKLEQAKAAFTARKIAEAERAKMEAEMAEAQEVEGLETGDLDVEPKDKGETI